LKSLAFAKSAEVTNLLVADLGLLPHNDDHVKHKFRKRAIDGGDQNQAKALARKQILNTHFAKARSYLIAAPR
jgi:hypothetical protein